MSTHFKRPDLAQRLVDELCGKSFFSDAPNGLFLAAPRRTGKSDFLQQDLVPALINAGIFVTYVDLWSQSKMPPTELVAAKLAQDVQKTLGWVAKAGKSSGLATFEIPGSGMKFDFSKVGKTDGMTLHQVLAMLKEQTGKRIALIIDEAQHALTSADGETMMMALKSARDQMKEVDGSGLLLVMSGSHRDKLLRLVNTSAAPFWGSEVRPLPTLGAAFALQVAQEIEQAYAELAGIDHDNLIDAFKKLGERPQFLLKACAHARSIAGDAAAFDAALRQYAQDQRARDRDDITQCYLQLSSLERALIQRMIEQGEAYRPYDAAAIKFYSDATGDTITTAQVQSALDDLRDSKARLVWKSLRGDYALYDQDMSDWYAYLKNTRQWPPQAVS
jgi:hypothetical protein